MQSRTIKAPDSQDPQRPRARTLGIGAWRPFRPRNTTESQNTWNLYWDIAWFGILAGVVSSFLPVFTLRLGGTDEQVGLLSALPALVMVVASIPGSRFVEREKRPLSVVLTSGTLHRAGYLAIGLLPFFVHNDLAWGVVLLATALTVPQAIATVAFTTMFARVIRPERRAHVVGVRNALVGVTTTLAALIGGKLLDWIVFPVNYQILFIAAFAASMMSAYHLSQIHVAPPDEPKANREEPPRHGIGPYLQMLSSSPGYTRFTLTSFVFQWGLFFTVPLYSIFWVRTLNASEGWVGLINMVGTATTIVFFPLWGRLTARRGNRIALVLTTAGLAGYPLLMVLRPTVEWMLFVSFWGGVFSSGQALVFFNGLLQVCPEPHRAARIGAYQTLANIAAFLSPLISTTLIGSFGIEAMLIIGGILRLMGSLLIWQQRVLGEGQVPALAPHPARLAR